MDILDRYLKNNNNFVSRLEAENSYSIYKNILDYAKRTWNTDNIYKEITKKMILEKRIIINRKKG